MKRIILFLMAGIMIFSLSSCGASSNKPIEIVKSEQGLYGLKQGSKWVAEPVYLKMVPHQFESGTFFIGKCVPGTQKYYHVLFDSNGKMLKECNIYSYLGNTLRLASPSDGCSNMSLSTMEEVFSGVVTVGYNLKDIFADSK
jgi:hypothetical protein